MFSCFSLAAFNILYLCLMFVSLISMCLVACFSLGLSCMVLFALLGLIDYFLFHVGEISTIVSSKICSYPFFFSSSGTPIIWMLVCLILSQRSLRLSSVLFILFTLFCSSEAISTILSSSSLIHSSASDILLLIPCRVFLGEGNGTRLQYSCLENPMDRGAW